MYKERPLGSNPRPTSSSIKKKEDRQNYRVDLHAETIPDHSFGDTTLEPVPLFEQHPDHRIGFDTTVLQKRQNNNRLSRQPETELDYYSFFEEALPSPAIVSEPHDGFPDTDSEHRIQSDRQLVQQRYDVQALRVKFILNQIDILRQKLDQIFDVLHVRNNLNPDARVRLQHVDAVKLAEVSLDEQMASFNMYTRQMAALEELYLHESQLYKKLLALKTALEQSDSRLTPDQSQLLYQLTGEDLEVLSPVALRSVLLETEGRYESKDDHLNLEDVLAKLVADESRLLLEYQDRIKEQEQGIVELKYKIQAKKFISTLAPDVKSVIHKGEMEKRKPSTLDVSMIDEESLKEEIAMKARARESVEILFVQQKGYFQDLWKALKQLENPHRLLTSKQMQFLFSLAPALRGLARAEYDQAESDTKQRGQHEERALQLEALATNLENEELPLAFNSDR